MSWARFLPLRFILRQAARSQGFLDPIELLARLRSLAQPSEVGEPIELLRAGVVFHARGLINSKVIQYNLDWVWPYWVERQYDPYDPSFIPRAFSASHINLSHRNWTAIGYPDVNEMPLVDPRGLLTPFHDGWSLDAWILGEDGAHLLPSRAPAARQELQLGEELALQTVTRRGDLELSATASVTLEGDRPVCSLALAARAGSPATLVLALRPQNPEGVSFVHSVAAADERRAWEVNGEHTVEFDRAPEQQRFSDYREGDVLLDWLRNGRANRGEVLAGECPVGLMTATAAYPIEPGEPTRLAVNVPLAREPDPALVPNAWGQLRARASTLRCPDSDYQFLYDAAVTSLILHSPGEVYPGPYTYKRFWFRDAAFILHALMNVGLVDRAERAMGHFTSRQNALGFFRSQEGEWDSNGEVLWILWRFRCLTGRMPRGEWRKPILKAARWIVRKRLDEVPASPHAGLLPPGFSAEHLGPNDYYYWDNFWCRAGLDAADTLLREIDGTYSGEFRLESRRLDAAIERSLESCEKRLGRAAIPASPYRRLDAGAIGSLAADYPLMLTGPGDRRILDTVQYHLDNCLVKGAFFQDMVHSGLNAYLTLHIAQVLLRAGDERFLALTDRVAALATSTGQWPEAIHPITFGGCMGDGHHVWAAAEWVLMVRNSFVREEAGELIVASGIPRRWLRKGARIHFGPAPTDFGPATVSLAVDDGGTVVVRCEVEWRASPVPVHVSLPGSEAVKLASGSDRVTLPLDAAGRERA